MKIIAKSSHGYIVEMSESEVCNAAGFTSAIVLREKMPGAVDRTLNSNYGGGYSFNLHIGTVIPVSTMFEFITKLREKEKRIHDGAGALRAMADLMLQQLPEQIIPPIDLEFREVFREGDEATK